MINLQVNRTERHTYDRFVLTWKHYYDFYLCRSSNYGKMNIDDCLTATIDPNLAECIGADGETLYSATLWGDAVNTGIELKDWGLCSVDNGYTPIDWKTDDLLDIFLDTTLAIPEDDKRFYMKPVKGNFYCEPPIDYSVSIGEENNIKHLTADGGFWQGFYKLFLPSYTDMKYQTQYNRAHQFESYEFIVRPRNIVKNDTLNYYFPDNNGFFFYKGTRAENKWWYYANKLKEEEIEKLAKTLLDNVPCNIDVSLNINAIQRAKSLYENLSTSDGVLLNTPNFTEFETDNKYLYFNRTCCGYTTCDKDIPDKITMGYQEKNKQLNYYLLFNQTRDENGKHKGLRVKDLEPISSSYYCSYSNWQLFKLFRCDPYLRYNYMDKPLQDLPPDLMDIDIYDNQYHEIYSDTYNNAMGFRITPDGRLGYRINIQNCDEDKDINPTKLLEEYSDPGIINWDQWNYIVVKIAYDHYIAEPECSNEKSRTGEIFFFVNGMLKFVSKKFMEPIFHELAEHWSKQEGVPFNISLMGGSQGLLETILSDDPEDYDRYIFPIEKHFTGTLMGDLRLFRMGECNIGLNQIRDNLIWFSPILR